MSVPTGRTVEKLNLKRVKRLQARVIWSREKERERERKKKRRAMNRERREGRERFVETASETSNPKRVKQKL